MRATGRKAKTSQGNSASRKVVFEVSAHPNSGVYLAGTFNNWNAQQYRMQDRRGNGRYSIALMLPKGEYEYKFVINGNWSVDPESRDWAPNSFGTRNSVKKVE